MPLIPPLTKIPVDKRYADLPGQILTDGTDEVMLLIFAVQKG